MTREDDRMDETIDLGAASVETRGAVGAPGDEIGLFRQVGLSDD